MTSTSYAWIAILTVNLICYSGSTSIPTPLNQENFDTQATLDDNNVDIGMNGGRPVVTGSTSNMLWQSSNNKTALYLHTNASGGGWGGVLELKRPGGGGTLGIKRPSEGGRPVVSVAGSTTLYESNGTTLGVNGMVDTTGNREGHMSIKRP